LDETVNIFWHVVFASAWKLKVVIQYHEMLKDNSTRGLTLKSGTQIWQDQRLKF